MAEQNGKSGDDRLEDFPLMLDGTPEQQYWATQAFIAETDAMYGLEPDVDHEDGSISTEFITHDQIDFIIDKTT